MVGSTTSIDTLVLVSLQRRERKRVVEGSYTPMVSLPRAWGPDARRSALAQEHTQVAVVDAATSGLWYRERHSTPDERWDLHKACEG
jgi:hypothetical protein